MHKFLDKNKIFLAIIIAGLLIFGAVLSLNRPAETPQPEKLTARIKTPDDRKKNISAEKPQNNFYKLIKVIDGDTIAVDVLGKTEKVRLIGIDAPEVVGSKSKTVKCLGKLASNRAKEILIGKSVKLEADQSQAERDKYGRLLRYVFLENGTNFNKMMVEQGIAKEYTYKNLPYKYQNEFILAEKEAREAKRGLWAPSACESLP